MIEIREEKPADIDAVRSINLEAFGQPDESRIVDKLRQVCPHTLSLVAVCNGKIVGHIFFSPVTIQHGDGDIEGMGLAPMAVVTARQNQGIGSMLIKEGIRRIKETACPYVVVLGHPHFYPRFGFERASTFGLEAQWEGVPDEAFMAMILDEAMMAGVAGVVRYRNEFDEAI